MRGLGFLAAVTLSAAIATPAAAVTFTGVAVFDDNGQAVIEGPLATVPGAYRYEFTLDTAVFAQIELDDLWTYDFYDAADGTHYGGNDVPSGSHASFFDTPVTYGSLLYTLKGPYEIASSPGQIERGSYKLTTALLTLYLPQAAARGGGANARASVTYTFSVTSVPEPSTWAVMVLGFGGLGAVMRGARRERQAA